MASKTSVADELLDSLQATFKAAPWWAGPIGVGITYLCFYFILPFCLGLINGDPEGPINFGQMIANISRMLAPFAAGVVGLVWVIALVGKFIDDQRIDSQRGLNTIRDLPWREFEQLLATAYRRQGYRVTDTGTSHGPGSPDGGIDLILERDSQRILVQCKQWKARKVGVKVARELYGLVASQNATAGILITSGHYTRDAQDFAQKLPLDLIDGPQLETLIRSVQRDKPAPKTGRPPKSPRASSPILTESAQTESIPTCPRCQSPMKKRTAGRGPNAGQQFWGCPSFPKCRGTRPLS